MDSHYQTQTSKFLFKHFSQSLGNNKFSEFVGGMTRIKLEHLSMKVEIEMFQSDWQWTKKYCLSETHKYKIWLSQKRSYTLFWFSSSTLFQVFTSIQIDMFNHFNKGFRLHYWNFRFLLLLERSKQIIFFEYLMIFTIFAKEWENLLLPLFIVLIKVHNRAQLFRCVSFASHCIDHSPQNQDQ